MARVQILSNSIKRRAKNIFYTIKIKF